MQTEGLGMVKSIHIIYDFNNASISRSISFKRFSVEKDRDDIFAKQITIHSRLYWKDKLQLKLHQQIKSPNRQNIRWEKPTRSISLIEQNTTKFFRRFAHEIFRCSTALSQGAMKNSVKKCEVRRQSDDMALHVIPALPTVRKLASKRHRKYLPHKKKSLSLSYHHELKLFMLWIYTCQCSGDGSYWNKRTPKKRFIDVFLSIQCVTRISKLIFLPPFFVLFSLPIISMRHLSTPCRTK